jgi:anti-sigma B factor antagonist
MLYFRRSGRRKAPGGSGQACQDAETARLESSARGGAYVVEKVDSVDARIDVSTSTTRDISFHTDAIGIAPAVVVAGDLDMASTDTFHRVLAPSLRRGGTVVVDMTNLDFMDSSGVHVVIEAAKELEGRGCLLLHGVHDPVKRLLDLVGITAIHNIHVMVCDVEPFPRQA